jgi:hypothetical protein
LVVVLSYITLKALDTVTHGPGNDDTGLWVPETAFVLITIRDPTDRSYLNGIKFARELEAFGLLGATPGSEPTRDPQLDTRLVVIDTTEISEETAKCTYAHAIASIPNVTRSRGGPAMGERVVFGPNTSTSTQSLIEGMALLCDPESAAEVCAGVASPWRTDSEWNLRLLLGSSTYHWTPPESDPSKNNCQHAIGERLIHYGWDNAGLAERMIAQAVTNGGQRFAIIAYDPNHGQGVFANSVYVQQLAAWLKHSCTQNRLMHTVIANEQTDNAETILAELAEFKPDTIIPLTSQENVAAVLRILDAHAQTGADYSVVAPDTWSYLQMDATDELPPVRRIFTCGMVELTEKRETLAALARDLVKYDHSGRVHAIVDPFHRLVHADQYALGFVFGYDDYTYWRTSLRDPREAADLQRNIAVLPECVEVRGEY